LNKSYGDKYTTYNEESVTGARYWDSKENQSTLKTIRIITTAML